MGTVSNDIKHRLKDIKDRNFFITEDENLLKSLSSEDIKVEYLSRTMIRLEDDSVDVLVGARFLKESIEVLKIELVYSFEVVDLNDVVKVDETLKKIDFPKSLLCTFLSVSMGSLRGVLYERVKGTELVNYFLPLVDMDVLLGINMFVVKK